MCFSIEWIENLCILIIVAFGLWALVKLALPYLGNVPGGAIVMQIITIVFWVIIGIVIVVIIFTFLKCLLGSGGGMSGLLPHR